MLRTQALGRDGRAAMVLVLLCLVARPKWLSACAALAARNLKGHAIRHSVPAAGRSSAVGIVGGRRAGRAQGRDAARRLAAQPAQHALHRQQLQVVQLGHQHAPRAPRLPIPAAPCAECQRGAGSESAAAVQAAERKLLSGARRELTQTLLIDGGLLAQPHK